MLDSNPDTWSGDEFLEENNRFIQSLPPLETVNRLNVHHHCRVNGTPISVTITREALVAIDGSDELSSANIFLRYDDDLDDACHSLIERGPAPDGGYHLTAADIR